MSAFFVYLLNPVLGCTTETAIWRVDFEENNMTIRQETPRDYDEVYEMVGLSFASTSYSDGSEADYLNTLRTKDTFVPELSLLALEDNIIAGQIVLYRTPIQSPAETLVELVISPLSVRPGHFRRGIATALVNEGLHRAQKLGYNAAFLCGDPNFYHKLGFSATYHHGIHHVRNAHAEWCMVREISTGFLNTVSGKIDIQ